MHDPKENLAMDPNVRHDVVFSLKPPFQKTGPGGLKDSEFPLIFCLARGCVILYQVSTTLRFLSDTNLSKFEAAV